MLRFGPTELIIILVIIILLFGMIQLTIWFVRTTVKRHNAFMQSGYNNPNEFYYPSAVHLVPDTK